MTKFFREFLRDDTGAAAAEYALILAIVGAGIAGAAFALGGSIKTAISGTAGIIDNCNGAVTTGCTTTP